MFEILVILTISIVTALVAFLLAKAQGKEVATMNVGDTVTLDGLDAQIISIEEGTFEVIVKVPKMRVSKKK
jgi:preprotein translocase subunit YajC